MRGYILLGLILSMILISGCVEKCSTDADCSAKTCSSVQCKESNCDYSIIADCCGNEKCEPNETYETCFVDCPNCDDKNDCTADEYDYHKQKCANTPLLNVVCCGNEKCELGEDYEGCTRDCPNCKDENECTKDSYDYYEQKCVNEIITPCCGNGICDKDSETYSSCPTDCPDCEDNNELTLDKFNYVNQKCENVVEYYLIDDFENGLKKWTITGDGEHSTMKEDGNTVLKLGHMQANFQMELDSFILKFRFKALMGSMHPNFRQSTIEGEWNRYMLGINQRGIYNLRKQVGDDFQTLKEFDFRTGSGWHTLEIRCYDNTINIYADDEFLIKYTDTNNPLLTGKIGFEVHTGGSPVIPEYLIDDVEIKVISKDDIK